MKRPKKLIILAGGIVLVIAASIVAAVILSRYQIAVDQADTGTEPGLQDHPAEKKADVADKLVYDGDLAAGVRELDVAIQATTDSYEQFVYYSRKATLLLNNNDLAGALIAATAAYGLQKTSDSAAFVGQIAREKGDTAVSIEYYKKAITLISQDDPFARQDKEYYEGVIRELGGTV
jgi:tetratricopeptide (TPR) repeat protein